ncbi:MAG: hypothetical protein EBR92_07300 [Alphaproteobacteria bacterium]|jgi:hypothetical protein|nr:hypothetical protein [Alphaproteobacteria bacterium]
MRILSLLCVLLITSAGSAKASTGQGSLAFAGFPAELQPLLQALRRARYQVLLAKPLIPGAYGATDPRKRTLWIAPITADLGILRQTLIHEATHAAQACPDGNVKPIGWPLTMPHAVDREVHGILYRGYPRYRFDVEREAFAVQAQPNGMQLVMAALNSRCR